MIVDEKALLGRNSIKMVAHCSFLDFGLSLGRFLKRLDSRLLFSREGADSKTQHSGSRISFYGEDHTLFVRYVCPSLVA